MIAHLDTLRLPWKKTNSLSDDVDDFSVFSDLELIISKIKNYAGGGVIKILDKDVYFWGVIDDIAITQFVLNRIKIFSFKKILSQSFLLIYAEICQPLDIYFLAPKKYLFYLLSALQCHLKKNLINFSF